MVCTVPSGNVMHGYISSHCVSASGTAGHYKLKEGSEKRKSDSGRGRHDVNVNMVEEGVKSRCPYRLLDVLVCRLRSLATETTGELQVLRLDRHTLGVDRGEVGCAVNWYSRGRS